MKTMGSSGILKEAMKGRGLVQAKLAERVGMLPNGLSGNINRGRISLHMFGRLLDAMGYDVCVKDRETGEVKWKVRVDSEE